MTPFLLLKNVNKSFPVHRSLFSKSNHIRKVIDNISLEVGAGEVMVLAGESGSGKTTLAKLIMGSLTPDDGTIYFEGNDIQVLKKKKKFYSLIQMIHQDPYSSLNPHLKVKDIVMEPLKIHDKESSKEEKIEKVRIALRRTKLEPVDEYLDKYPTMLSGGQRQRVSIARAIVQIPKLIIADEPVSMLDISVRAEILSLLNDLRKSLNISIIYITHDLATSRFIGDKLGIMFAGNIVEYGDIDEVLHNPLHPYTWMLLDAVTFTSNESKFYKTFSDPNISAAALPLKGCKFYNRCKLSFDDCTHDIQQFNINNEHAVSCFYYKNMVTNLN
ncbi:MAG TPA: ABC transporter ATP-binding protein [Candidatus Nitrosocosmicus sp.]|nr:ABC transporter ATP-binding protein [Candidatus Nitrosocosmicus sp.]